MVTPLGDYNTTETVHIPFNTFDSNDPSESVTITDFALGDIKIYKDGSTTERASTSGITVDDDFDGKTGAQMVHIDLSNNDDPGFYAAGSRYMALMEGVTVDGGTLNSWIGVFTIGITLRPTTAGRTLDILATGEAAANLTMILDHLLTDTGNQLADRFEGFFDQDSAGFNVKTALSAFKATGFSTHDAAAVKTAIEAGGSSLAQILEDTGTTLDALIDAIKAKTDNLPASPAAVGSEMTLEADAIKASTFDESTAYPLKSADTGATEIARTGADGDTLEDLSDEIAGVSAGDATEAKQDTIIASLTAAKGATFNGATDSLEAIRNRGDSAWVTGGAGGGSETWPFTLTEAGSGEPVANASVWVTADEAGEGAVIVSGYTDTLGVITFYLDPGTYYFWAEKSGWNFSNPYTQEVS